MAARNLMMIFCLGIFVALTSCDRSDKPFPEPPKEKIPRAWEPEDVDRMVVMENILIPSVPSENPFSDIEPPEPCNYIHFLRFRLATEAPDKDISERAENTITVSSFDESPVVPEETDAVLLLMPGFLVGANGFELFGR